TDARSVAPLQRGATYAFHTRYRARYRRQRSRQTRLRSAFMDPALRAAATGMQAQQTRTEIIAHNLANVNTTGYKRSRAHFEDLLYQTVQGQSVLGQQDAEIAPAIQIGR